MEWKKYQVVVTGIGIISANGKNVEEFWRNVQEGVCGIKMVQEIDTSDIVTDYGGEVHDFDPTDYFSKRELKDLDRSGQFAVLAAREAVERAGLQIADYDPYRIGLIVGTSLGGILSGEKFHRQWIKKGIRQTNPAFIYKYPIHVPADNVARDLGVKGPKSVISNACAAGTNAIGYAMDTIRSGQADVVITGGVDPLTKLSLSGFNSLQALCDGPSSPYSRSDGVNIGEGAAFLVLERRDVAIKRGATILAEVLDYALSADCYHQTAPDPAGSGALQAMRHVLQLADIPTEQISYINGHGTGTPANDSSEPKALRSLLKDHKPPISSTKSMIGHMLGAAGAAEAVTSILAIRDDIVPPTINFKEEEAVFDFDFVPNKAKKGKVDVVLSNSFAFGGNNATILFQKDSGVAKEEKTFSQKRLVISGIGAVAGNAKHADDIFQLLQEGESGLSTIDQFDSSPYKTSLAGIVPNIPYRKYMNPSLLRKMDTISKQATVTTRMALQDAKLRVSRNNSERIGLIFATGTGPIETVEDFNRVVIEEGAEKANARLFPNTVMNAAAGHIGVNFKLKGPTTTICAGGVSAINALFYANNWIQQDLCDQVIVVTSDEFNEPLVAGLHRIPGYLSEDKPMPFDANSSGHVLGSGSVAFVVESDTEANERGATILAEIKGFGLTCDNSRVARINPKGEEWKKSFEFALAQAKLTENDIDFIASAAGGLWSFDKVEAEVIHELFGADVPVSATKSVFGETHGTAGALGILSALLAFNGTLAPIQNIHSPHDDVHLNLVTEAKQVDHVQHSLISSFTYGANYQSLVLGRYA